MIVKSKIEYKIAGWIIVIMLYPSTMLVRGSYELVDFVVSTVFLLLIGLVLFFYKSKYFRILFL